MVEIAVPGHRAILVKNLCCGICYDFLLILNKSIL